MAKYEQDNSRLVSLCMVAAEITEMRGAGVMLLADDALVPTVSSNDVANELMDLEILLGEGPGTDATKSGHLSANNDLSQTSDWKFYASEAVKLGVQTVTSIPLNVGFHRIGALTFYGDQPSPMSRTRLSDGYLVASVIVADVFASVAEESTDSVTEEWAAPWNFEYILHQAAGIISVQACLEVKDALSAIRSHAFTMGVSPRTLAFRIVNGEVRFDLDSEDWSAE